MPQVLLPELSSDLLAKARAHVQEADESQTKVAEEAQEKPAAVAEAPRPQEEAKA